MEVILTQEVRPLGLAGQKVSVKDGYDRNFLMPRGLAVPADRGADSASRARLNANLRSAELAKEKAVEIAAKLEETTCRFSLSSGEQGKLHGAVTASDIARELQKQGISIEKHQIQLEGPLSQLGEHPVPVRLHPGVKAAVKVLLSKA
jgi:large subunit ribosomal protein L9